MTAAAPLPALPAACPAPVRPGGPPDGPGPELEGALPEGRFLDREQSWLQFNERVLELAGDAAVPLLERARFLSIFASNLDEFFMVRVAGLQRRIATGLAEPSPAGLEPAEVLAGIGSAAHALIARQGAIWGDEVAPALAAEGIHVLRWEELDEGDHAELERLHRERIFPVLTPMAVDPAHPFPYVSGLSINLAVRLRHPRSGAEHFARVKVPEGLPRLVRLAPRCEGDRLVRLVPVEDVVAAHLDALFPGMTVLGHSLFRVTRNADLEVGDDEAESLLQALEKELSRRRFGPAVRLEVVRDIDPAVLDLLVRELDVEEGDIYRVDGLLDLRCLSVLAGLERSELHAPPFRPRTHPALRPPDGAESADVFAAIRHGDVLLHHPYDSFATSVQAFLDQAAADPDVVAVKATLYRTSGDSPVVRALIAAAEAGKQVLAVIEIKARFDESNNIAWARRLEQAGAHVVYGILGLKTHAKITLVVRQEDDGLRRYCHIATGNYNPRTARTYEDLGLLTCDPVVGEDLTRLFNLLSGWAPGSTYERLVVAPRRLRPALVELIEEQAALARAGRPARVQLKVNALVDEQIIDALYRASRAGVDVDLLVRGICVLRPGVPGLSERIRVRSILGRVLEHSRVYVFGVEGPSATVLIGSPDLMHRNLDRRVEALVRLTDLDQVRWVRSIIDEGMAATTSSWHLEDDRWVRHHLDPDGGPLREHHDHHIAVHTARRAASDD